jgi:hypothetical protein
MAYAGDADVVRTWKSERRTEPWNPRTAEVQSRRPQSHTRPHPVDIDRLVELAEVSSALAAGKTTILKDNISWHFPLPAPTDAVAAEGTICAARRGFGDQVCVQNKTVVTNAFKGEDLNHYVPIFKRYRCPSSSTSRTRT